MSQEKPWLDIQGKILDRPNYHMRNWQTELREAIASGKYTMIAVTVCRRGGKDFSVLGEADIQCITHVGSNVGYLGLAKMAVKKILTSNSHAGIPMYKEVIDCKGNLKKTRGGDYIHKELSCFKYKNGSINYILGTDQGMELGTSMNMLVITESARIPFSAWEFLIPTVKGMDGVIIHVSTPYFGSEFNSLVDGTHKMSETCKVIKVPANELYHADGTRVYSDEKLAEIASQMDYQSFLQEYMVDTKAINRLSILGESLRVAKVSKPKRKYDEHFYSFDLGQADSTAMTCAGRDYNKPPVVYDYMVKNKTRLMDFSKAILEDIQARRINPSTVTVLLPFDSMQEWQGYEKPINRYKEMKKHLSELGITVKTVTKVNKIRGLQMVRHALETGILGIENTKTASDWTDIIASVDYKKENQTNKIVYEIDKRSGAYGDHPLDSLRYLCVYLFKELFQEAYWEDHTYKYYTDPNPVGKVGDVFANFKRQNTTVNEEGSVTVVGKSVDDVLSALKEIDRRC